MTTPTTGCTPGQSGLVARGKVAVRAILILRRVAQRCDEGRPLPRRRRSTTALEVMIEGARSDPGFRHNLLGPGGEVALLDEQLASRGYQCVSRALSSFLRTT